MHHFVYRDGDLMAEEVSITVLAQEIQTPFYCYSHATLQHHYNRMSQSLNGLDMTICYSVKANSSLGVLLELAKMGSGADIVSEGELYRALSVDIPPEKIIFSGVGKTERELEVALKKGIAQFNVESIAELELLSQIACRIGLVAQIALRINPDIDAGTHEKISTGKAVNKFGIAWEDAENVFAYADTLPNIVVRGISVHIGSQITDIAPFKFAFTKVRILLEKLRHSGHVIDRLDLGGGLGVPYGGGEIFPPDIKDYGDIIGDIFADAGCHIFLEPGRVIVANAGILVTSVIRTKKGRAKNFVIVDASMTELPRPALYGSYHDIVPVQARKGKDMMWDVVGPVCESGDFLGLDRVFSEPHAGDLFVVHSCGAYAAVLASCYNTRLLAPEVIVKGDVFSVIRPRADYKTLLSQEKLPNWHESS